jgi:CRISPR-associated endonuclease/helicase Cas3
MNTFSALFQALTGTNPFPWQQSLYESFVRGEIPSVADIPTGLGKTSVVAIWLIALINHPNKMPRRLVYVVNRRTVVDQTTTEVMRLRERLQQMPDALAELQNDAPSLLNFLSPSARCAGSSPRSSERGLVEAPEHSISMLPVSRS